jgi:hypothetical protein
VNVTATNDAPVISTLSGSSNYTENAGATALDTSITLADADNANLTGATISISSNFVTGDTLNFVNQNGITYSYNAGTGVLTLSGTTTLANYKAALESITFNSTSDDPSNATRTITYSVTDGTDTSNAPTYTVNVTAVNDAPVLSDIGASTAYTQNGTAVVIDASATIVDVDDTNIESATVSISAGGDFVAAGGIDALNYSTLHGVTGSYDNATGILTLTGSATKAQYEAILESVTFSSTSATSGDRTISYKVNDGALDSTTQTATINYSLSSPPTLTGVLNDQNTAANQAANAWTFDASTAFGGTGTYSLTSVTNYSGTDSTASYSINPTTGIITNLSTIPNTTTAYIFPYT